MTAPRAILGGFAACLLYATFAHGAQDPTPQTWTLLALIALATYAFAATRLGGLALLSRLGLVGIAGFAAWAAFGITTSVAPDRSWADANLVAGYALTVVIGLAIGASLPRAARWTGLAIGGVMLTAALYALLGKTLPGVVDTAGLAVAPAGAARVLERAGAVLRQRPAAAAALRGPRLAAGAGRGLPPRADPRPHLLARGAASRSWSASPSCSG